MLKDCLHLLLPAIWPSRLWPSVGSGPQMGSGHRGGGGGGGGGALASDLILYESQLCIGKLE